METPNMCFVTFRDVDGHSYVTDWQGDGCWGACSDSRNKKLFTPDEAQEVLEGLRANPRHESDPDDGFFQVRVWEATASDYLWWFGPSRALTSYLTEGNTPEDLVKLLWEMVTHEQRVELEQEVEEYQRVEALHESETSYHGDQ